MNTTRSAVSVWRSLALLLLLSAVPALADWRFAIPPGWDDLSPGKPIPKGVPAQVAAETQGGHYHTYAMDIQGKSDGFATNLNVIVAPGPMVASERLREKLQSEIPYQVSREMSAARGQVVESSIVTVGGQPAIRFVMDVTTPGLNLRILKYILSGGKETAIVSYASTPKAFPKYLPVFEAAIQQTQGIAPPPVGARIGERLRSWGGDSFSDEDWKKLLEGGGRIVGILVGVTLVGYFSRRKKKTASP